MRFFTYCRVVISIEYSNKISFRRKRRMWFWRKAVDIAQSELPAIRLYWNSNLFHFKSAEKQTEALIKITNTAVGITPVSAPVPVFPVFIWNHTNVSCYYSWAVQQTQYKEHTIIVTWSYAVTVNRMAPSYFHLPVAILRWLAIWYPLSTRFQPHQGLTTSLLQYLQVNIVLMSEVSSIKKNQQIS